MPPMKRLAITLLALQIGAFVASDLPAAAGEGPTIDAATRKEVVDKVAEIMTDVYVTRDVGIAMGEHIKSLLSAGEYGDVQDLDLFCRELTTDLREISHDKHLYVFYSPEEAREVAAYKGLLPADEIAEINRDYLDMDRRENFGFHQLELLAGNVGYLDLDYFSGAAESMEVAAAAMAYLANADAIIIDLRDNGGGGGDDADIVGLLISYFFESGGASLTSCYFRESGETVPSYVMDEVPGKRRPDVDLYILTSARTFSAAEAMPYALQALKRAVVVGEVTKGGANPVDVLIVKDSILTQVSIGKPVNPITGCSWEGVGVQPDIAAAAKDALRTAHIAALRSLLSRTTGAERQRELASIISQME
jgi:retinol-binding protein 3